MEERRNTIRDPKLPSIHADSCGNGMEQRRCGAPLPTDLADAFAQQNLSL